MGLALLFPGQGAQHAQMLPWLFTQPQAQEALAALDAPLGPGWRERLPDADWLHRNRTAQPLLTGLCIATWQALADELPAPVAVAGYSVGELAAFSVAGVLRPAEALHLSVLRAQAMDDAASGQPGGLLAVQGPLALGRAQAAPGLSVAIRIGPERVLVGGPLAALEAAAAGWTALGLRCTRLPIGVASHTPAMAAAADALALALSQVQLQPAHSAVVCNFTGGAARQPAALRAALAGQIAATVRWDECMDSLAERSPHCVLELGPGATLAAMWRERHPGIPVRSADEFRSREGLLDWVRRHLR